MENRPVDRAASISNAGARRCPAGRSVEGLAANAAERQDQCESLAESDFSGAMTRTPVITRFAK
jgi:hypothetical protein